MSTLLVRLDIHHQGQIRRADLLQSANYFRASLGPSPSRAQFADAANVLTHSGGGGPLRGVTYERGDSTWTFGLTNEGAFVDDESGALRLWYRPAQEESASTRSTIVLYLGLTMLAILVLLYVGLTRWIVRPLEQIRLAAERISRGRLHVEVTPSGAAETWDLGVSFQRMTRDLRREQKSLEEKIEELSETTEALRETQAQVERAAHLASVGRLAAGVAHEVGNPLAAIAGLVELAKDDELPEEKRTEFLSRVEKETERIGRIIGDLLRFARPGDEQRSRVTLGDVVADAVALMTPIQDTAHIRIEQRVEQDAVALGSHDELVQVLLNLLLNATDAIRESNGEGTIVIEVEKRAKGSQSAQVALVVSDDGPGIDDSVVETIFEPFVTTKSSGKGTGLGLAVCIATIERLGGEITASNGQGGGARFEVCLPAARSDA